VTRGEGEDVERAHDPDGVVPVPEELDPLAEPEHVVECTHVVLERSLPDRHEPQRRVDSQGVLRSRQPHLVGLLASEVRHDADHHLVVGDPELCSDRGAMCESRADERGVDAVHQDPCAAGEVRVIVVRTSSETARSKSSSGIVSRFRSRVARAWRGHRLCSV